MQKKEKIHFDITSVFLLIFLFTKTGVVKSGGIITKMMSFIFNQLKIYFIPSDIIEYGSLALFVFLVIIKTFRSGKFKFTKQIKYYAVFVLFACLSYFWALNKSYVKGTALNIVSLLVFLFALTNYIDSKEKFLKVMKYVVLSNVIVSFKIILLYWIKSGTAASRIASITGIYFNTVGQVIGFSIFFAFYLYKSTGKKFYLYSILPQYAAIFLTESRKSLLIPIIGFLFILIIQGNVKKIIKFILYGIVTLGIVVFMLQTFNSSILLNVSDKLGNLVKYVANEETNDWSINLRTKFIDTGKEIFKKYPINGIGLNNFSYYAGHYTSYGIERYAHNNYIEILSCLGLIGLVLYYMIYLSALKKLLKILKKKRKDIKVIVALSFLLVLMIMEWGIVSYSGCLYHIYILFVYYIIFEKEKSTFKVIENG